ncbi:hypothetical protein RRG08_008634 [Elysia crispata]|uniref:SWIM-type domain-containing protein n=1 Tax=Elysia crispata TaxID=231223 RepID=A0AAE0XZY5_9GAST|nr:hypothetical protein RRG08_008634 [Elysia crispata]
MPQVEISLCHFHMKQAFKRAFQGKGLAAHIVKVLQDIFEQQANALTEDSYNNFKDELSSLAPPPIVEYLQRNWWNCPQMWANFLNLDIPRLHVTTTNHFESYHGKIKTLLHSKISLSEALLLLQKYDSHLLQVATVITTVESMKRRYNSKDSDPVIGEVYLNVTSFAARLILEQYEITKKFSYSFTESANDIYELKSSAETVYHTTSKSCNCKFFVNLKLQCRHIFALRKHIEAPLYQNIQCDHRFSRN